MCFWIECDYLFGFRVFVGGLVYSGFVVGKESHCDSTSAFVPVLREEVFNGRFGFVRSPRIRFAFVTSVFSLENGGIQHLFVTMMCVSKKSVDHRSNWPKKHSKAIDEMNNTIIFQSIAECSR